MVYKLVEIRGLPRIKLSETKDKITLPCRKNIYRLYGKDNQSIVDLICLTDEEAPVPGERILVRHPFDDIKRLYVTPSKVELLHELVFDGQKIKNYPL